MLRSTLLKFRPLFFIKFAVFLVVLCFFSATQVNASDTIRYVALGDSYTIGTGVNPEQAWPAVLVNQLQEEGVSIELAGNLAKNGWTSFEVSNYQIPQCRKLKPDVITVLVGVNDLVQGVPLRVFEKRFKILLDEVQKSLKNRKNIILLTIPDFSLTPAGKVMAGGRDVRSGIVEFNEVIRKEAEGRQLLLVDLFEVSDAMGRDVSLIAPDGLHPSSTMHMIWEKMVYRVAGDFLKNL